MALDEHDDVDSRTAADEQVLVPDERHDKLREVVGRRCRRPRSDNV